MDLTIIGAAVINGILMGGIYTLVASGLTLIYGVLHIINFAHGSFLMVAMFGVFYLVTKLGVDPYLSLIVTMPSMFVMGYVLYKYFIGKLSYGKDENILLITLGLSIVIENLALMFFTGDSRTISLSYSDKMFEVGPLLIGLPKVISFVAAMVMCALLGIFITQTDTGRAIRAVAKERMGAPVFDLNGVYASVEEGMAILKAIAPDAQVGIKGEPLAFPMDKSDEPLKAFIGDYGQMPLAQGIEATYKAFAQLLQDKRISAAGIA